METILKWAGGKRLLINQISKIINPDQLKKDNGHYYEPFIGGGAIAFSLELNETVINDSNKELINMYNVIKNNPSELIELLKIHQSKYSDAYYERIRKMDRSKNYDNISNVEKAARFIFLNKTCYNGLYRVNSSGHFNVPKGKYKNPDIIMEKKINGLSRLLNEKSFKITCLDFEKAVEDATKGDVVYFDPPYDYEETGFTSYSAIGFNKSDLVRLKNLCDRLIDRGCRVIISNNDTKFVNELFKCNGYKIVHIEAFRFISCDGSKRSKVKEVIIYG
ncbi:MAG: Dam family site-specific DNA-(adenine-N6)-methyltransferase [Bacilli bacterium]|nr:Dam family site-specific DNA-(adenine-N6)-methyltransferase [Bacilli bacterium]MBR1582011.1 Dam family site-specific DNA-(adenine-N6)-methyltransferase [Bacilli bacterium]